MSLLRLASLLSLLLDASLAQAQLTPDATLGPESSTVNSTSANVSPADVIEGGAQREGNLFHSFSAFNVRENQQVYFANPSGIERIFNRVTGGNPSSILGTLGVLGNADLFLLNPNGVIFGPNARLDIGGSLIVTSADSVVFENDFSFSAHAPQAPPLLTMTVPLGLQMGSQPGALVNQSIAGLEVPPQETLAFIGGELRFDSGVMRAASGHIDLAALGDNSLLKFEPVTSAYATATVAEQPLRPISLSNGAFATVSGEGAGGMQVQGSSIRLTEGAGLFANTFGDLNGGQVTLRASETILLSGTLPNGTSGGIFLQNFGSGNAANLSVNTRTLTLEEGSIISVSTFADGTGGEATINATDAVNVIGTLGNGIEPSSIYANTLRTGTAGTLTINTRQLRVLEGGFISVDNSGAGTPGTMIINATDLVELDGTVATPFASLGVLSSGLGALTFGSGDAGQIIVNTRRLIVTNSGQIFAASASPGTGNGGSITVNATELIQVGDASVDCGRLGCLISSLTQGDGDAGNIKLTTPRLVLRGGGQVSTSTFGSGNGGTIEIDAEEIDISSRLDFAAVPFAPSAISAGVNFGGAGQAGAINIRGNRLIVSGGGRIGSRTSGSGNGGNVTLQFRDSILVTGREPVSGRRSGIQVNATENASGNAGDIDITTPRLTLQDGGGIGVNTFNSNAGNLTIRSPFITLEEGGLLSAVSAGNQGGNVILNDANLLVLRNESNILAQAIDTANGGNIEINAPRGFVVADPMGNSDIIASAEQGNGGNIAVTALGVFGLTVNPSPNFLDVSEINASSEAGIDGTVVINDPAITLQPVTELPVTFSAPPLTQGCGTSANESRFTNVGRSGVPANPTDPLTPAPLWYDFLDLQVEAGNSTVQSQSEVSDPLRASSVVESDNAPGPLRQAQGWVRQADGTVQLLANVPTATPPSLGTLVCFSE